jgi:hypothetical protein
MPGAAFYQGLNAAPDFKQRRLDSMQNITIATRMRDDSIAEMQERLKAMGLISTQLNKEAELQAEMLPADAERFKSAHEKLMTGVVDELGKYNNDPNMLRMMAPQVADKYSRDLISSPELRSAKENRKNFDLGTAAIQKGDMVDDVEIEYPGGTKETVPWIEAVDLHQQGAIKKLPFKSSMPVAEVNPLKFLNIEMPSAEGKYKGKVSLGYVADVIQAENPRYTRDQAMKQANLYADPETPGATHFLWGRVIPRYQGGGGSSLADMKYMDKIQSVKSVTDNLHRAMFDPSMKTSYDPKLKAYNLNVTPLDLTKIHKGTGKGAVQAESILVKNDPTDPAKSRFIISYGGDDYEELSFDDLAQRVLGASNVNISDYTNLMQMINGGPTSTYNPMNYSTVTPEIPFEGAIESSAPQPSAIVKNDPQLLEIWKAKYGGKKRVSYGAPSGQLEAIPGWE